MRKLVVAVALAVGLLGYVSSAQAALVDVTLLAGGGQTQVWLRSDIDMSQIGFGVATPPAGALLGVFAPGSAANSYGFDTGMGIYVYAIGGIVPTPGYIPMQPVSVHIATIAGEFGPADIDMGSITTMFMGVPMVDRYLDEVTDYQFLPEPGALTLLGLGLAGLAFIRRR